MYIMREEEVSLTETPTRSPWEIGFVLTIDRGRVSCLKFLIHKQMANNVFPEIIRQDDRWFLRVVYSTNEVKEICLPNNPTMNRIWEASSKLLPVYDSDCGGNITRCIEVLREVSKNFAGIAHLLADQANDLEMDLLYAPDPDENWYNK